MLDPPSCSVLLVKEIHKHNLFLQGEQLLDLGRHSIILVTPCAEPVTQTGIFCPVHIYSAIYVVLRTIYFTKKLQQSFRFIEL